MELLIIFALALLNGFLAMSELAVVSARRARLQQMRDEGNSGAQTALDLAEAPNRFLSTVQIGISLIGVLAGAFGGAALADDMAALIARVEFLAPYSQPLGFALIVLLTTYLSLVFGELVPKRIAIQYTEATASLVAPFMQRLSQLTYPLVVVLSISTDAVLSLLRIQATDNNTVSEEEITMMLREGAQRGEFTPDEPDMIAGVFRLDDLRVDAIMTPRTEMIWLDVNDSFDEVRYKINDNEHSRYPVADGDPDNLVGVVKARDLLKQSMRGQKLDLRVLLLPPFYIPESSSAAHALTRFRDKEKQLALVVGEHGGVEGLVTINDILEAIVGDLDTPEAVQREDGSWLVDGMMPVAEFKAMLNIRGDLPGEGESIFQTVGGFFMSYHGDLPTASTQITWEGYRFEVMDMDGKRIDKLLVEQYESGES